MATHLSGRYSPPPRRKSPSNSSSQSYLPHPRDRFRDRSLPPRRHNSQYDSHENDKSVYDSAYRQPNIPPSQRPATRPASPYLGSSHVSHYSEQYTNADVPKSYRPSASSTQTDVIGYNNSKREQEEIFKQLLEVITDVSFLKIENKRAVLNFEASKEKYDKSSSHHTKFPNLKSILLSELDKAKQSVEKTNEELIRRDAVFRELAGQSIPVLLPAIQASGIQNNRHSDDNQVLEGLEKVVSKSEQQYTDLLDEFKRFKEEQKIYQSTKDKQIANQEIKLKEMLSNDSKREQEIANLRTQLHSLNYEVANLRKECLASQKDIVAVKELAENAGTKTGQIEMQLTQVDEKNQEKLKFIEAQIGPVTSIKSSLKTLRENGLFDLKISTVDDISATLKVAASRIDSLPSAASYFSLNSRLEILEKKQIAPESLLKNVSDIVEKEFENRLKKSEAKTAKEPESASNIDTLSSISSMEAKIAALTNLISTQQSTPNVDQELNNLRNSTVELQRSLNVVRINVAGLHERSQSTLISGLDDARLEKLIEAKSRKMLNDYIRKVTEVSQGLAATNHSVENLMARVDNISTGHLAQAMLNQLSETYPHVQNAEQLLITQGKCIQELQVKLEHLSNIKPEAPQSSISNGNNNNSRNLGKEVDKVSEDIFKINLSIKKLIGATEENRKLTSEKILSRLDFLATTEELKNHKIELDAQLKTLVEKGVEEHSKNVLLPQIENASKLFDLELSTRSDMNVGSTSLAEKNASALSKMEEGLASMKEGLMNRIKNEIREQKKNIEELITTQVDKSLISKRSEFVKEVARRVELKISVEGSKTGSENSHGALNSASSSTIASSTDPFSNIQINDSQRNKRKLQEIKEESSQGTTNFSRSGRFITSKKSRFSSSGMDGMS